MGRSLIGLSGHVGFDVFPMTAAREISNVVAFYLQVLWDWGITGLHSFAAKKPIFRQQYQRTSNSAGYLCPEILIP